MLHCYTINYCQIVSTYSRLQSSLFHSQPLNMYICSIWISASTPSILQMSVIDMYTGMSIAMLDACILRLIPTISWSLFSVWLWWDSQSAMYRSGPGLYNMHTLYWWMLSIMHCSHYKRVVISLLTIATNGFWSVIMFTSLVKQ